MGTDASNNKNKKGLYKLAKKKLLPEEYEQYLAIGEPDLSQDWLEIFTPTIVSDLFEIMHCCSDNQLKAGYIEKEMKYYGFATVGEGTNIFVMSNPVYPGVVFKFALDECGLADNYNDSILEPLVNEYLGKPRYTKIFARHPSGIVSVQERKIVVATQDRMDQFRKSIMDTIKILAEKFLIVDISPYHYHLNYGINRDGSWCFLDASDLYPLENMPEKVRCHKPVGYDNEKKRVRYCGGKLYYNYEFSRLVCSRCHAEYTPLEVRPNDKEEVGKMSVTTMLDGMTEDEREEMRLDELKVFNRPKQYIVEEPVPDPDEEDEDEAPTESDDDDEDVVVYDQPRLVEADPNYVDPEEEPDPDEPEYERLYPDNASDDDDDEDDGVDVYVTPKADQPRTVFVQDDEDEDEDGDCPKQRSINIGLCLSNTIDHPRPDSPDKFWSVVLSIPDDMDLDEFREAWKETPLSVRLDIGNGTLSEISILGFEEFYEAIAPKLEPYLRIQKK